MLISFTIDGVTQVSRSIDTITTGIKDWSRPLENVGDLMLGVFDKTFPTKGGEIGESWPARKDKNPWPLLQKTGDMRGSFDKIYTVDQVLLFNTSEYFRYHQRGTSKMPRRMMMKIDDKRASEIVRIFRLFIQELTGSWGRGGRR